MGDCVVWDGHCSVGMAEQSRMARTAVLAGARQAGCITLVSHAHIWSDEMGGPCTINEGCIKIPLMVVLRFQAAVCIVLMMPLPVF